MKEVPKFESEKEEREFWETHDSTEYVDWDKAGTITEQEKSMKEIEQEKSMKEIELRVVELEKNMWQASLEGQIDIVEKLFCDTGICDAVYQCAILFGPVSDGEIEIDGEYHQLNINFQCQMMDAQYNDDLVGYELVFDDGLVISTQFEKNSNVLDAGYGDWEIEVYTEGSDADALASNDKMEVAMQYCTMMHSLSYNSGKLESANECKQEATFGI